MIPKASPPTAPRDLLRALSFHDAVADRIAHDAAAGRLVVHLDLSLDNQAGYEPACDPETVPGELRFEGVRVVEVDPPGMLAPLPAGGDAEIFRLDAGEERGGRPLVTLVLRRTRYAPREEITGAARFHADTASFHPDER